MLVCGGQAGESPRLGWLPGVPPVHACTLQGEAVCAVQVVPSAPQHDQPRDVPAEGAHHMAATSRFGVFHLPFRHLRQHSM
eukprot:3519190-Lingulodinium_polyedra.AAC.1